MKTALLLYEKISQTACSLLQFTQSLKDAKRVWFVISALKKAGYLSIPPTITDNIIAHQHDDGGWSDVLESAHCIYLLGEDALYTTAVSRGVQWLRHNKVNDCWGLHSRDIQRIPVTAHVCSFLPNLANSKVINWLCSEWTKDLSDSTTLSYKAGFFLLSIKASNSTSYFKIEEKLIKETINFLMNQQHEDGGFGPWRNHPIGSDPWSTGVSLLGLASFPEYVDISVFSRCLEWLEENQLPNGLWPCHYIEEGSAYCYWGTIEALKVMKKAGHTCAV